MTEHASSMFETPVTQGNKHHSSFAHRMLLWIEGHQQRKADREIARIMRATRR